MGPVQKFLSRVGSYQIFVARAGLGQPSVVWVWIWKISPKNVKFFNFLPFGSKKSHRVGSEPGRPLIYCGSKVCLGRVRSGLISTRDNTELPIELTIREREMDRTICLYHSLSGENHH